MKKLYTHLFEMAPELKEMFGLEIDEISKKQAELVSAYVKNIENLEVLEDRIKEVVQKHVEKRVQPHHYKLFGEAFMKAVTDECNLTYAEREAWKEVYNFLANILSAKEKRIYEMEMNK